MRRLAQHGKVPMPGMPAALRRMLLPGSRRSGDIAAAFGAGEHRLQQLFQAEAGLRPQQLCRLARLRECLRRLRDEPALPWVPFAADCGFCGQTHLVKESRALCGVTPGGYLGRTRRR